LVAPAKQLSSADTVCLAITGAADKKTLAHPGRATAVNCSHQSPWYTHCHV